MSFIDMTGQRFGRLIAISYISSPNFKWFCHCDCGKTTKVLSADLRRGVSKSCGCIRKERGSRRMSILTKLENGKAAQNRVYSTYIRNAKKRGLIFDLSKKEFEELTQKICHYCGSKPSQKFRGNRYNGNFIYNGIDRLDNNSGYSVKNCVSCCKKCNSMKSALGRDEFLAHIEKIYEWQTNPSNFNR